MPAKVGSDTMGKAVKHAPWPVLVLIVSFLAPTELSLFLGGIRLPLHRVALLVLLPLALLAISGRRGIKIKAFDVAFALFAGWTLVIFPYHHGLADGLQTGGSLALDSFASYIIARVYVRDIAAFRSTAALLLVAVGAVGLVALPEAITGNHYVHDYLRQLTGYNLALGDETRFGLTRAYGTFDHPIHLGTFCAVGLAMSIYAARGFLGVAVRSMVIGGAAFLALSSAPLLGVAMQMGMAMVEKLTRKIKDRVRIAVGVFGGLLLVLTVVASRSPFAIIATGLTIDKNTGFYRLMIWQYCLENIWANPLTGIGLNDWARPVWMYSPTIDSFWLVVPLRQGLPPILFLIVGIGLIAAQVGQKMRRMKGDSRLLATGWMISLVALILVAFTVHYWNVPYAYFFFFLGLGAWLVDPLRASAPAAVMKAKPVAQGGIAWVAPGAPGFAMRTGQPEAVTENASAPPAGSRWPIPVAAPRSNSNTSKPMVSRFASPLAYKV